MTIEKMAALYNADPSRIIAGIGPSICGEVYEVGSEVAKAFGSVFGSDDKIVTPKGNNKYLVDLWEANRQLLMRAGVTARNIEVFGACTYKKYNEFFSARRSENKAGRFGAGIMLLK